MKLLLFVTVLVISTFLFVDAKKKPANKYEGDFEFVDEVNAMTTSYLRSGY